MLLALGFAEPATAPVRRMDRAALFWLYENLGGENWTRNQGWAAEGAARDPCFMNARWVGVGCLDPCDTWRDGPECTAGRVTAIYLSDNNLIGGLGNWSGPAVLTNLSVLDLSFNRVSGTIPTQLGRVSNLQSLQLQNNLLTGNLPSQLGEINGAGALPVWSYGPTMMPITSRLEDVQLHDNNLTGAVPTELGVHTALAQLNLHRNNLTGYLPTQLGALGNLRTLYVQQNTLSGTLPTQVGNMGEALHFWDSSRNQLSGVLPPSLGSLRRLNRLSLAANRISGTLPANLTDMRNLRTLLLADNAFTGNLPLEIGKIVALEWLDVYNNQMSGDVPASIADLQHLEHLYLANDHLRPVRQGYCGQRQNPRLGKYSWRLVREEYHKMMSTYCADGELRDTAETFDALPPFNGSSPPA